MPKAIWKGGISFGLVYIPVRMYSGSTSHDVDLDMIRRGDRCPIKYVRVCKEDGKEVPWKDIVKAEEINPRYFDKPYLLEPEKGAGKTYNLLRKAIHETGMAGLSKFVLRNREHVALLMADEKVLYFNQMRYHDELRKPDDLHIPGTRPSKKELDMAKKLIKGMTSSFRPEKLKDTYQQTLKKIIDAKSKDKEIEPGKTPEEESAVEDLMDQLKKSLEMTS